MVQIIQSGPSEATIRQQALNQAFENIMGGVANYQKAKEQQAETKRQQALGAIDKAIELRSQGYDVTPQQVSSAYQSPESFSGLFDKRTEDYQRKLQIDAEKRARDSEAAQAELLYKQTQTEALKAEAPLKREEKQLQLQKLKDDIAISPIERRKREAEIKKIEAEASKVAKATAPSPMSSGKQMSAKDVATFNEGNQIPTMLQDVRLVLEQNKDLFGPIAGRIASLNPYDERTQTAASSIKAASQAFGRYMEGGVLRKEDEVKYEKMFPQISDTPDVAKNKLQIVNKLLVDRQTQLMSALKNSGYDTGGIDKPFAPASLPGALVRPQQGQQQSRGGLSPAQAARLEQLRQKAGMGG